MFFLFVCFNWFKYNLLSPQCILFYYITKKKEKKSNTSYGGKDMNWNIWK